jgi:hypothetical protein
MLCPTFNNRFVPTADIANLFPCELDRNMLPRDGSGA